MVLPFTSFQQGLGFYFMNSRIGYIFVITLALCTIGGAMYSHAQAQLLTGYQPHQNLPEDSRAYTSPESPEAKPFLTARKVAYEKSEDEETSVQFQPEHGIETEELITPKAEPSVPLAPLKSEEQIPVDFTADNLMHDEQAQVITASGNVILIQGARSVKADEIRYYMNEDKIVAMGNVILLDENGDTHMAEEAVLNNALKEGFIVGLRSYLAAGGRLTAEKAERKNQNIIMTNASYTPCDCEENENGDPDWQIRADELTYDEQAHRVSYKNAQFEIFGVPVFWTPYLAHSDGQIKRKSGLLSPAMGYDSDLGLTVQQDYYWNIAPDKDATVGIMLTTQELPVAVGQYRQRFENASLILDGSVTYSGRTDIVDGTDVLKDDEARGHLFAEGRWDINNKWRAGLDLELAADDQYLRQYDFSSEDVLENEIFVERFSGRNYAVGRALSFQDVRIREERVDQPNVLPEVIASFVGEPNQTLGGRWKVDVSTLALQRDSDGQDMARFVLETNWQRRFESDLGLLTTADVNLRGDAYYTGDRELSAAAAGKSRDGSETRAFAQAHIVSSYPLVKDLETSQVVVEPLAALTLAPNINSRNGFIPNEDSQDVQLDASNLFNADRFPGKDRIEDSSRATYGLKTGIYEHSGSYLNAFVGQSYRFNDDDNPFPDGSGLARQESDVVGQLSGMYQDDYGFNYRYQLDSDKLSSQRHEFDGYANWDKLSLSTRYLYAKALEGTDIDGDREQIDTRVGYHLTPRWRVRGRGLYDLGDEPGLRKAGVGLDYFGCCVSFSLNAERSLTSDASGDSGTDITFRMGLKNIGEFETSKAGQTNARN